jgi:hypothetical protein
MTKYVIGPDVALRLAHDEATVFEEHQLPAPTLLRSQLLSLLHRAVHQGEMTRNADRQLNDVALQDGDLLRPSSPTSWNWTTREPINEKYAERRAATSLYRYCTGELPPGGSELEPCECELY